MLLIDASGMSTLMKKNLGKKHREFTPDCVVRIARVYAAFKTMEWKDDVSNRDLKAKVLGRDHFFYRKVTIERPLRMRYQATADAVTALQADKAYAKLPDEQVDVLAAELDEMDATAVFMDADTFRSALQKAAFSATKNQRADHKKVKLSAKTLELTRKCLGTKDKKAEPTTNEKGDVVSDSDLRDAESVPYGEDIDSYFKREVVPHWPDAWINYEMKDEQDDQTGVVGTEINFNREFYIYTPPRSREAIQADIEAKERRFMELLRGVRG